MKAPYSPATILRRLGASVVLLTLAQAPSRGGTVVMVEDNFDRTGALVGSNADTGQTWTGSGPYITTGTAYQVFGDTPSFSTISGLVFIPDSTYCLTVDVTILFPISDGWLGLGFSRPTSTDYLTATVGTMIRLDDPEVRTYVDSGSLEQIDPATTPFPDTLRIFLDTGATLASSTLSWQLNGSTIRSGVAVDATGIDGIFLAHDATDNMLRGEFDRLQLLGPVPEPSSILLLGFAGLAAVMRRNR